VEPRLSLLIEAAERGEESAADALFSALYAELHRIARRELARQGVPVSMGATTLLHQAYIEMADKDGASFPDRRRCGYVATYTESLINLLFGTMAADSCWNFRVLQQWQVTPGRP
jgi:hypothetical protein